MILVIAIVAAVLIVGLLVIGLCLSAAEGDRQLEEQLRHARHITIDGHRIARELAALDADRRLHG